MNFSVTLSRDLIIKIFNTCLRWKHQGIFSKKESICRFARINVVKIERSNNLVHSCINNTRWCLSIIAKLGVLKIELRCLWVELAVVKGAWQLGRIEWETARYNLIYRPKILIKRVSGWSIPYEISQINLVILILCPLLPRASCSSSLPQLPPPFFTSANNNALLFTSKLTRVARGLP